ncbi:MAG: hypothetical protein AAF321_12850, partial [Pseudomonadota bacterium]
VIARGAALSDGFAAHDEAHRTQTGRPSPLTETAFAEAVSPETFVARRDRMGGPAPSALKEALDGYSAALDDLARRRASRAERRAEAELARRTAFAALATPTTLRKGAA